VKIAVIGAGWAGLAAAIEAVQRGHRVTLFEAARTAGGRARSVSDLDNGQHILIGAYRETLRLMRLVGVDVDKALLRLPLTLTHPDGTGLRLPDLPSPWNVLLGVLRNRAWPWHERLGLLRLAWAWRRAGFECGKALTVRELCQGLGPQVMADLIEPLCVAALNTPAHEASAQVFLRVLHDALFSMRGGSDLLLPRKALGDLFPEPALRWLQARGADIRLGHRIQGLDELADFDAILLACPAQEAARLAQEKHPAWSAKALALRHTPIATVYAQGLEAKRPAPMLALRGGPAQFVFDKGLGLFAFVASACEGERQAIETQVLRQGLEQLGLALKPVQTIVEKRATFACTPGLARPSIQIAQNLYACGDYVTGPYPATLEGAVQSGIAAAKSLPS
jgi:squalene-associated FAD-dependent desaturase